MHDDGGQPVPARFDVNAPDLYIPLMAFITYVLISGFVLGVQGRSASFSYTVLYFCQKQTFFY